MARMSSHTEDLDLLTQAARAAGKIARKHFRKSPRTWDKGDGQGPVTEADLAIDRMLSDHLRLARPAYGWLSEESVDDPARLDTRRQFIIDPIDGTRAFIAGERSFAVVLAVVEEGAPVASAIYMPMLGRMFTAVRDLGAQLNGAAITRSARSGLEGAQLLVSKPHFLPEHWLGDPLPAERHWRSSLAYRMALVAQGRFDGMVTLRPSWEWDIAAGDLIAREAGAASTDRTGGILRFNNPYPQVNGVFVATPAVHTDLLARATPQHTA
jgi:myo-inositol-1(or 4)-monophosphatase